MVITFTNQGTNIFQMNVLQSKLLMPLRCFKTQIPKRNLTSTSCLRDNPIAASFPSLSSWGLHKTTK